MRSHPTWLPWHHTAWRVLNVSTAPIWLLMLIAPGSKITARAVAAAMPLHAVLGLTYAGLLATEAIRGGDRVDFTDGESVARSLSNPVGMLSGWTHYLTFDLFVGTWIWKTAQEEGIGARLALLGTWWFGPIGLTWFQLQRRRATSRTARSIQPRG